MNQECIFECILFSIVILDHVQWFKILCITTGNHSSDKSPFVVIEAVENLCYSISLVEHVVLLYYTGGHVVIEIYLLSKVFFDGLHPFIGVEDDEAVGDAFVVWCFDKYVGFVLLESGLNSKLISHFIHNMFWHFDRDKNSLLSCFNFFFGIGPVFVIDLVAFFQSELRELLKNDVNLSFVCLRLT
jgi:hypothetical protein